LRDIHAVQDYWWARLSAGGESHLYRFCPIDSDSPFFLIISEWSNGLLREKEREELKLASHWQVIQMKLSLNEKN